MLRFYVQTASSRKMGETPEDLAFERRQTEMAEMDAWVRGEQEYAIYQDAFHVALSDSLVQAARTRSHQIYTTVYTELLSARNCVNEAVRLMTGSGVGYFDPLLVAWLRAYRATEWYEAQLGTAIATAVTEPFNAYLKPGGTITAREFFKPTALRGLRDAVLAAMFDPEPFVQTVKEFVDRFGRTRHTIVHEVYQPQVAETKACVAGAIAIYNLADGALNGMHRMPLDIPSDWAM
ncbi:MAG TPA: hypothetical protein VGI19_18655 [Candidatus Cybelea sp.]|jgi:hypothetical protein